MTDASRASPFPAAINLRRMVTGIASGMALQSALPMVEAQEYELVPPVENGSTPQSGKGVTVRARIDVLFFRRAAASRSWSSAPSKRAPRRTSRASMFSMC